MRYNTLRDRDGNRIGAYQFVYDVTERLHDQERLRHAEAALRQTQKLESIGQLTGGVAHDFNNLLAVFATGLQLLERNVTVEQRQRVFEGMRRAVTRGTGLTRHLLAFSRRRPVNPESIDVAAHLKGMREMLDGSLGGHIQVEMNFDKEVWPVEIDAGELELAILNLCLNARDAMPDGGAVTITAENVHGGRRARLASRLRQAVDDRYRLRNAARGALTRLRTVLHDQGRRQGIRIGPAAGVWVRESVGRESDHRQRGRRRHDRDAAAAPLVATAGRGNQGRRPIERTGASGRAGHAGVTCCSSKTTRKCRRSRARC